MYTKRTTMRRYIIHYNDIIEFSTFFEKLAEEENGTCTFHVLFRDGSSVLQHSGQFFQEPYFKHKDALSIRFDYRSCNSTNEITLSLHESHLFLSEINCLELVSNSESWINATAAKINDLLSGLSKPSAFRTAFAIPWIFGSYIVFLAICHLGMRLLGFSVGSVPLLANGQPDPDVLFVPMRSYLIAVTLAFALITMLICLLYPEQEFAFGASVYPRRIKIRKYIGWIIVAIIIPIVLSLMLQ